MLDFAECILMEHLYYPSMYSAWICSSCLNLWLKNAVQFFKRLVFSGAFSHLWVFSKYFDIDFNKNGNLHLHSASTQFRFFKRKNGRVWSLYLVFASDLKFMIYKCRGFYLNKLQNRQPKFITVVAYRIENFSENKETPNLSQCSLHYPLFWWPISMKRSQFYWTLQ